MSISASLLCDCLLRVQISKKKQEKKPHKTLVKLQYCYNIAATAQASIF